MDLRLEKEKAQKAKVAQRKFLDRLKRNPPRDLDQQVMEADEAVFAELDCLDCANCCKTISPIFTSKDVERIAGTMGLAPGKFMERYLRIDEEQDMVLKSSPCPFLEADNRCRIYEDRPKACREYPHTDRKKMVQIMELTAKNTQVCPAVFEMVERLRKAGL